MFAVLWNLSTIKRKWKMSAPKANTSIHVHDLLVWSIHFAVHKQQINTFPRFKIHSELHSTEERLVSAANEGFPRVEDGYSISSVCTLTSRSHQILLAGGKLGLWCQYNELNIITDSWTHNWGLNAWTRKLIPWCHSSEDLHHFFLLLSTCRSF